jgi:hypothetical protein
MNKNVQAKARNHKARASYAGGPVQRSAKPCSSSNQDDGTKVRLPESDHISSDCPETKNMRNLQFPNARLFLHRTMVTERVTSAEAMARGAYEFGLLQPGSIDSEIQSLAADRCNCMAAGKAVLSKYFDESRHGRSAALNSEELWSQIERDAELYSKAAHKSETGKSVVPNSEGCNKFAPTLFDLILQQIQRYP